MGVGGEELGEMVGWVKSTYCSLEDPNWVPSTHARWLTNCCDSIGRAPALACTYVPYIANTNKIIKVNL